MKKCIICEDQAAFKIRSSSEFYCPPCATENFSDVSLLESIEYQAQQLKEIIDKMNEHDSGN
ncbi:MAG: hypothetical protein CMH61_00570 [Nanoarchaeota archaeon]|nr:hypothetical protein [Nanoarchaeota archaeon]|tara:strand:- start:754 stop:939 length:186 start_codon:yes stop_codon:yes gene_type:complete